MGVQIKKIKYKHKKSVRFKQTGKLYMEYDEHDRDTYHSDGDYWALKFYHEPNGGKVDKSPYQVVHKYWELYNS